MIPNKLPFDSENLIVDYLSFKFQNLQQSEKNKLATYFLKLRFNSYSKFLKFANPIKNPILNN